MAGTKVAIAAPSGLSRKLKQRDELKKIKGACTMKRFLMLTVAVALTVVALAAPNVWAGDVQGKIKSVDQTGRMLTLEDGTQLMIPATVRINRQDLTPGADVKASYEDKGNQKVVTTIEVQPAK